MVGWGISGRWLSCIVVLAGGRCTAGDLVQYGVVHDQSFVQAEAGAPVGAGFADLLFARPTQAGTYTTVYVSPGTGAIAFLNASADGSVFRSRSTYASRAALEQARPAGNYTFELVRPGGFADTIDFAVPPGEFPIAPAFQNASALHSVATNAPLAVSWNNFTSATGDSYVQLSVADAQSRVVFETPFAGLVGGLSGSRTNFTLPASVFTNAGSYTVTLAFQQIVATDWEAFPEAMGVAVRSSSTRCSVSAGSVVSPRLQILTPWVNGAVRVQVTGEAAASYQVEYSADLKLWESLGTVAGNGTLTNSAIGNALRFYRAKRAP